MGDGPRAPFDSIDDEEMRELIDAGLVEEKTKMIDGREQTVYRLTELGEQVGKQLRD